MTEQCRHHGQRGTIVHELGCIGVAEDVRCHEWLRNFRVIGDGGNHRLHRTGAEWSAFLTGHHWPGRMLLNPRHQHLGMRRGPAQPDIRQRIADLVGLGYRPAPEIPMLLSRWAFSAMLPMTFASSSPRMAYVCRILVMPLNSGSTTGDPGEPNFLLHEICIRLFIEHYNQTLSV